MGVKRQKMCTSGVIDLSKNYIPRRRSVKGSLSCFFLFFKKPYYFAINSSIDSTAETPGRLGRLVNHSRRAANLEAKVVERPGEEGVPRYLKRCKKQEHTLINDLRH